MTKEQIIQYYRIFAIANLCFSFIYVAIPIDMELSDKISNFIDFNIGYHLFYFFLSRAPLFGLNFLKRNNSIIADNLASSMTSLFSLLTMTGSLFIAIQLLINAFSNNEYLELFEIFVPVGLFLGAYSLKLSLNEK
jgi:hypothetical protein